MNRGAPFDLPLRSIPLVAVDFETTGAVPGWPVEPWQLGLVRFSLDDAQAPEVFESLVRVGDRPFHRDAPGRHRERRADILAAPTVTDLTPRCLPWWGGGVLVAHNASTERRMIRAMSPLHGPVAWIDTLPLARRMFPGLSSHALEDLVPALGLQAELSVLCPGREPHDALYDAQACRLLLRHITGAGSHAAWTLRDWLAAR